MNEKFLFVENALLPHVVTHRIDADWAHFSVWSDIHQGLNCRWLLQKAIQTVLNIKNYYIWIGGDSTNSNTKNSKGIITEEWASGDKQIITLAEDLKPLYDAGRILGISRGNHTDRVYNDTYIVPEIMLACLLGNKELYKGHIGLLYFNVKKNLYIHYITHKNFKQKDYYDFVAADYIWREHFHAMEARPKLILEHNRIVKKPIVKRVWDIQNGSFQVLPEYAKANGYKFLLPGYYVANMNGDDQNRIAGLCSDDDFTNFKFE